MSTQAGSAGGAVTADPVTALTHTLRGVHRTRVEWIDTDAAGIYHNSTVTRYAEAAEAELMRSRGLWQYFPRAPRVRFEVDFEAPLCFGQQVTAVVELECLGTASMSFRFEIWGEELHGRPRTRAASGRYVTVHVEPGRDSAVPVSSTPWPVEWVAALQRLPQEEPRPD
ncbi:acyl-CoA thioester hydrolase [Streptosporangium becharense]|uniref:Acyl-CoA thioester hydrolase n=1 Tax=Streptosporangium becharense TaxID=1816182 RepID=A0A7W9IA81_9ACTN|nr:acyl-CoA thioesterase [Streptosporangium becharense]MBB2915305.1 acyl-CoA thioester hydrolase [Streptosporangium becharense]MBB5816997.1 acyl-CoA thioester hydrolase [Streptosporangium becharense]